MKQLAWASAVFVGVAVVVTVGVVLYSSRDAPTPAHFGPRWSTTAPPDTDAARYKVRYDGRHREGHSRRYSGVQVGYG